MRSLFAVLFLSLAASGCTLHTHASDFSGVAGIRGEPIEYQVTTSWSLRGLYVFDLWGDASTESTIAEFTEEASQRGATRIDVTQSKTSVYWYMLPPISFFICPVATYVQGNVEGSAATLE